LQHKEVLQLVRKYLSVACATKGFSTCRHFFVSF